MQIVKCAERGLTDSAIAKHLEISEATISTYWARVRMKLGPHGRTELVSMVLKAERDSALKELRNENAALTKRINDLTNSIGEASSLRDFVEGVTDAVILVKETGLIGHANPSASKLFGYASDELENKHLQSLIPARLREKHLEVHKEFFGELRHREMGEHYDTPALHKDGSEFLIRAVLSPFAVPEGTLVSCLIKPV